MKVKNNYNECITNIACSIRKYFELEYKHNTLKEIDDYLYKYNPKNVVVFLFDGMGSKILNRNLPQDSFFRKNMKKEITTVFPATTTAATTSIRTGLNPIEHGWMGWNTYIGKIDKTIQLFLNREKGRNEISEEFLREKNILHSKSIAQEINDQGKYQAYELLPFGENSYQDLDNMLSRVENLVNTKGKKYIYAYDEEPDHTMHDYGPDSKEAIELIKERNEKVEKLINRLKDSLVIIIADHGHTLVENVDLKDYKEITSLLERTTSLEPRATSFKIKRGKEKEFEEVFNKTFGNDYKLYSKEDVIESKLFGDGIPNENYESAIGDYIAIAYTNKCLLLDDEELKSHHAGYLDDEIYIPLIITYKN